MNKYFLTLVRWWVTPKLPLEHILISSKDNSGNVYQIWRDYFAKWIVHPIKRRISKYYIKSLREFFGLKIVGITGSTGKTSTKEMIFSILEQKGETVASFANIDPVYNIPTTILSCKPTTKYLVLEMGVEYPGEMDFYLWLARPDIGIIINIHPTHTEYFGGLDGVAKEKSKLVRYLPVDALAILGTNNKFFNQISKRIRAKLVTFGEKGDVFSERIQLTDQLKTKFVLVNSSGKISIQLPVFGKHFVENALAASAAASTLGFSNSEIKKGLENYEMPEHRMTVIKLKSGALVLDDSYNNNPAAAAEAITTLLAFPGERERIFVFGDMLELGKLEKLSHQEIGRLILTSKIDKLICVGKASKYTYNIVVKRMKRNNCFWIKDSISAVDSVKSLINRNSVVLVKGSRSIGLEKLVETLK